VEKKAVKKNEKVQCCSNKKLASLCVALDTLLYIIVIIFFQLFSLIFTFSNSLFALSSSLSLLFL